jgi:uncharacterized membrane protein YraQ (UPF0718 family)
VFSPWSVPEKKARKWMWIGLAIVAALQFYYVQEMIAAFVVLGVLFALVAGAGLLVLLADRTSKRTPSWVEMCALAILRTARRGVNFAGTFIAKRAALPPQ